MALEDPFPKIEKTLFDPITRESVKRVSLPIPYKIGPYRIKGLIKKGETSVLYLGESSDSQELIAVKVLSPKYLSHPEMMGHFLKEAKIIEMANHPNIVKLYGYGEWEGGVYIAMEFVQGITLRKLILQNTVSFKRALEIILEVCSALKHLHAYKVIHRDLKPENILLSESGGVKIIDFGIAQLVEEPNILTRKRQVMGTLSYMSPEQKTNPQLASYASDQYALAIITYELCRGRLSYGVLQLSLLPKGLRAILIKALKVDARQRWSDIEEFAQALNHYIQEDFQDHEELLDLSFKELAELNEISYFSLLPQTLLKEKKLVTTFYKPKRAQASHFYSDAFSLSEDHLALFFAAPEKSGPAGIFSSAFLKGSARALRNQLFDEPEKVIEKSELFIQKCLELIQQSEFSFRSFFFLLFSFKEEKIYFFSKGSNQLWMGEDLKEIVLSERIKKKSSHPTLISHPFLPQEKCSLFLELSYPELSYEEAKTLVEALQKKEESMDVSFVLKNMPKKMGSALKKESFIYLSFEQKTS